ncbi:aminotransferase class I/II-fold pyridoxal phosphate-dependent enzyme [Mycetocola tolaasinivorans]|uniref:Aminotransferase class I/II-fold pyridoxal phosphate-dependent enzyme n=1 Tax=Mycetocola tolaasinivorans TaxID=76635 RepID=A0A3L7A7W7_9MICO|nr:aminotransferase class I/II-fold pyridoxal phosphate-dependent enzyme [Mycetocola tolaasinivorans]RLP76476.1 aminotransferase class I/II-fold pyridoxal phosphate-dependent enzyme [Mycetocola tolaasinivorans]
MTSSAGWYRAAQGAGLLSPAGAPAPSIFTEMSALATRTGAINLGQGFPDEDGPAEVLEAARSAISAGANQYPPGRGTADLRLAIAEHRARFWGDHRDPDTEVLVTAGATEALAAAILGLTEPGDEVVTFEPFYDAYGGLIALAGARHVTVPLHAPLFEPDPDEIRRAITDNTRIILVNTPHNPTGSMLSTEILDLIVDLANRHDAIILTDEVYEHLTYDRPHVSVTTRPGAAERTLTVSSGGKTFATTGWKIGWVTGPADLITRVTTVKQFLSYVNGAPFQPAIAVGLRLTDEYFRGIAATLRGRRGRLADGLRAAGFGVSLPAAGYFIVADAAPLGLGDAETLARELPERIGIAAIPVGAFMLPEHRERTASLLRFAFCKRDDVLTEALARLGTLRG